VLHARRRSLTFYVVAWCGAKAPDERAYRLFPPYTGISRPYRGMRGCEISALKREDREIMAVKRREFTGFGCPITGSSGNNGLITA
jgi:hypothetical protein